MATRPAALAGTFYTKNAEALRADVRRFVAEARVTEQLRPKALIAPHAGLIYSGAIAGSAYAQWAQERDQIERVVLLGPAHRVFVRGLCAPSVEHFETPLGPVRIDTESLSRLADHPEVNFADHPHHEEHSLEVQLPFLQEVLGDFSLVPLLVGAAEPSVVADVLERLWAGPETRIVVSSDLSHFHHYNQALDLDRHTSATIEALDPSGLGEDSACGRIPVGGLLIIARRKGLSARTLDLRNSGDTAGPKDRVVGYGAYAFYGALDGAFRGAFHEGETERSKS